MGALVIKSWKADVKPIDSNNNFVFITGRQSGLLSWLLSLMRIDPTTTILVGADRIEFSSASLAGTEARLIPLENICSTYYGYHKPWKAAAYIVFFAILIGLSIGSLAVEAGSNGVAFGSFFIFSLIGLLIAAIYYFINRKLTLGFVEASGHISAIRFKRSVIENISINEDEAKAVCILVQRLIESKRKRTAKDGA